MIRSGRRLRFSDLNILILSAVARFSPAQAFIADRSAGRADQIIFYFDTVALRFAVGFVFFVVLVQVRIFRIANEIKADILIKHA